MNPDLEKLIRLQRAESELRRAEAELAEVPRLRQESAARLAQERSRLEAARDALALCQKSRRQHEAGLEDLGSKLSRYKGQLMEVKTNKEYTAMLHEIEAVQRETRSREDEILAEMEKAEALASEIKREEAAFKEAEQRDRQDAGALEDRARALEEEARRWATERDAVAGTVPPDLLHIFRRVARLRGVAVAEARDGMCQLCHLKLRLQMYADLKRNEEIAQCPACSRILFYTPPVSAPSPGP